jgi:beta-glucosidase
MSVMSKARTGAIVVVGALGIPLVAAVARARFQLRRTAKQLGPAAPRLEADGIPFRDLNKNGRLDVYEDPRRPIEERVEDLLGQMHLEEKCGLMVQAMISAGKNGSLVEYPSPVTPLGTHETVVNRHITHYNLVFSGDARSVAIWYNRLQLVAEQTRLGIPITISSDPRHATGENPAAGILMKGFSHWPDPLGLGATRDAALVEHFGDIARREYVAVGIRSALHPMADLATEPRWARMAGTFGEDADLAAEMTAAYIRGFQGDSLGPSSVACMVKHFPGGGPQKDGLDPHFPYGRDQAYPGDNFDYHLIPFPAAFEAGVEQVMPYYGIPVGQTSEDVAMGFNADIITSLLRERYGFDGVVCSDWGIVEGHTILGRIEVIPARAWGVEHLTVAERYAKAVTAGIDQFGGQNTPHHLVQLVRDGVLDEARIDESARRLLTLKFKLGLFDDPYVDVDAVDAEVGRPEAVEAATEAHRRSVVLLKIGERPDGSPALPVSGRPKLYVENVSPEIASRYGDVVDAADKADLAILRLETPCGPPRSRNFLERLFHQGDLDFKGKEKEHILSILETVPTIVDIHLERAAVIPEIAEKAVGLLATFGSPDDVVMDAVFGVFGPTGELPIELPSSMEAVQAQREDVPFDSEDPLFEYGHGLRYE